MGSWYRVTKRINGRLYDYWQKTYRVGGSVKTLNKYIGPAGSASTAGPAVPTTSLHPSSAGRTLSKTSATYSSTAPYTPEAAKEHFKPAAAITPRKPMNIRELNRARKSILKADDFDHEALNTVQDELDYAHAVRKQEEQTRAARAKTKHLKPTNYFMAQALLKNKK